MLGKTVDTGLLDAPREVSEAQPLTIERMLEPRAQSAPPVLEPKPVDEPRRDSEAPSEAPAAPRRRRGLLRFVLLLAVVAAAAGAWMTGLLPSIVAHLPLGDSKPLADNAKPATAPKAGPAFKPTEAHWASLTVEPVQQMPFRTTLVTDGKIAINEDQTTPVYSPYVGRVMKLFAKPGDTIEKGKQLFTVEASDMVQGQNDFLAAKASLNKAKSQLAVAEIVLNRHKALLISNAVAKRDMEQAEIGHVTAVNDLKAAEVALEAARNRLRILGKTDAEITAFETGKQRISAETIVLAPISGTVVQKKVGPGQLINGASTDPVYVIGDLSAVWVVANVRETDATKIKVGQQIEFTILALPDRVFKATVEYVSSSVNPDTRRLQVRATIANADGVLRPEMFANVTLVTADEKPTAAVPRHAVIFEGDEARVWVVRDDRSIELRKFVPGIVAGGWMQVASGIAVGEKVITRGSLFIDRIAAPAVQDRE